MINIVVVSHSALLARGVEQLARQMMRGDGCKLALAAGVDDEQHPIGTDAVKVMEAIEAVADGDGVLVLMDLGSALLSAETALDLLDPDLAAKVRLCAAPLVEGTLAAVVAANSGASLEQVVAEAQGRCRPSRHSWVRLHRRRKRGLAAGAGQKRNLDGAEPARAACAPGGAAGRDAGAVQGRAGAGEAGAVRRSAQPQSAGAAAGASRRHRSPDRRRCAGGRGAGGVQSAGGTTFRRDGLRAAAAFAARYPGGGKRHQRTRVPGPQLLAANRRSTDWCGRGVGRTATPAGGATAHAERSEPAGGAYRYADRQAAGGDLRRPQHAAGRSGSAAGGLHPHRAAAVLRRAGLAAGAGGDRRRVP